MDLSDAVATHAAAPTKAKTKTEKQPDVTQGTRAIAKAQWRVEELLTSPDGSKLAFMVNPINKREEKFDDYEIYVIDLQNVARAPLRQGEPSPAESGQIAAASRLTHNEAVEH